VRRRLVTIAFVLGAAFVAAPATFVAAPATPLDAFQGTDAASAISAFDVNGLQVIVKRRMSSPTVSGGLFLRGGSRNITAANAGIEALMLDAATEASTALSRDRVRRELSRTGTVIGSAVDRDYSAFTLGCTRRYFDSAWTLFADLAMHPSFAPDDVQRVKERQLVALQGEQDSPDAYLQDLQARVIYTGHPYANNPDGTVDSVAKLGVDDLKRYHQNAMQTSRLLLVLVGDLDPQDVRRKVEATIGTLPRGRYAPAPVAALSFSAPTVSVTAKSLPTHYIQGVYAAPSLTSTDIYPMRVATSILRDRIFEEVRFKRALSYAPDASLGNQAANIGSIYATAEDANQTVRVMLGEIAKLRSNEVSVDEIQATAQEFLTDYYLGQETNAAQAGTLARAEIVGGGWRTSLDFLNRVRAVTPMDVRRVAQTYMKNLQFVVLGDPTGIDKDLFLQPIRISVENDPFRSLVTN